MVPIVTTDAVRKAVQGLYRGKAAVVDGVTLDLIKDGVVIIFEKLAPLFTKCLKAPNLIRQLAGKMRI